MHLKCISWNILADRYSKRYGSLVDSNVLLWTNRILSILNLLKSNNADIICLQEVELQTFQSDFNSLFDSYDFFSHTVSKKRTNPIGNVIFWRKGLQVIEQISNSCGVHIILQLTEGCGRLWISNVHLKAKTSGEAVRHSQIVSCLNKWQSRGGGCGVICGDFNDTLFDPKTDELVRKELEKHKFEITLTQSGCMLRDGTLFNFDHICNFGVDIKQEQTNCIYENVLSLNNKSNLDTKLFYRIPNQDIPSDHFPLVFEVTLKV